MTKLFLQIVGIDTDASLRCLAKILAYLTEIRKQCQRLPATFTEGSTDGNGICHTFESIHKSPTRHTSAGIHFIGREDEMLTFHKDNDYWQTLYCGSPIAAAELEHWLETLIAGANASTLAKSGPPGPMLWVTPTKDIAQRITEERIQPQTRPLSAQVADAIAKIPDEQIQDALDWTGEYLVQLIRRAKTVARKQQDG
jgi:hypothetical protein